MQALLLEYVNPPLLVGHNFATFFKSPTITYYTLQLCSLGWNKDEKLLLFPLTHNLRNGLGLNLKWKISFRAIKDGTNRVYIFQRDNNKVWHPCLAGKLSIVENKTVTSLVHFKTKTIQIQIQIQMKRQFCLLRRPRQWPHRCTLRCISGLPMTMPTMRELCSWFQLLRK